MNVNRQNYKEWCNSLLKGELNKTEEELLFQFFETNHELIPNDTFEILNLSPNNTISFPVKEKLRKEADDFSDIPEIELLAIKKMEGLLTHQESEQLDTILEKTPEILSVINGYQTLKLKPEINSICIDKSGLKHHTIINKPFTYGIITVAASLLMVLFYILSYNTSGNNDLTADNQIKKESQQSSKSKKTENVEVITPANKDTIQEQILNPVDFNTKYESIEPYIELNDPMMAMMQRKDVGNAIDLPRVNAYEAGLNEMMPLYLDNQIRMKQLEDLFAETYSTTVKKSNSRNVRALEKSIFLTNLFSKNKIRINKYYDDEGNLIAYKLKGEGLEWTKKMND